MFYDFYRGVNLNVLFFYYHYILYTTFSVSHRIIPLAQVRMMMMMMMMTMMTMMTMIMI